ncbi:hypothetical protein GQ43DRAFT_380508, partial [Delitschia confertaspora ATCC 74209]
IFQLVMMDPGITAFVTGIALSTFSTVIVAFRLYCRYIRMHTIHLFDYFIIGALLVTWGNTVLNYYQVTFGAGVHFPDLITPKRPQVLHAIFGTLITWYIYRMSYPVALCLVKFSLLFFYRTLATSCNFRRIVTITIAFVGIYTASMIIAGAFQCRRPSDAWSITGYLAWISPPTKLTHGKATHPARQKCFDPTYLWAAFAGVNLFTDIVVLVLPIPMLLSLRLPLTKRLGLVSIFSLGFLAIVASSLRVWILTLWAESVASQQKYGTDLLLWGQVEINSGIVSASIPFLKQFFTGRRSTTRGSDTVAIERPTPRPLKPFCPTLHQDKKLDVTQCSMGRPETEPGEMGWRPFITVPANLSSKEGSKNDSVIQIGIAK